MAMRPPIFTKGDLSSSNPAVVGAARAAEDATMSLNSSKHKRQSERLTARSTGATPVELTNLGIPAYRFRTVQSSTSIVSGVGAYHSGTVRNAWQFTAAVTNIDGVLALLGTPLITKYGAGAAALTIAVDNASESLTFSGTGVAGDTNGRWEVMLNEIVEVTEDAR